jgi:hypothetical protein
MSPEALMYMAFTTILTVVYTWIVVAPQPSLPNRNRTFIDKAIPCFFLATITTLGIAFNSVFWATIPSVLVAAFYIGARWFWSDFENYKHK